MDPWNLPTLAQKSRERCMHHWPKHDTNNGNRCNGFVEFTHTRPKVARTPVHALAQTRHNTKTHARPRKQMNKTPNKDKQNNEQQVGLQRPQQIRRIFTRLGTQKSQQEKTALIPRSLKRTRKSSLIVHFTFPVTIQHMFPFVWMGFESINMYSVAMWIKVAIVRSLPKPYLITGRDDAVSPPVGVKRDRGVANFAASPCVKRPKQLLKGFGGTSSR